MSNFCLSETNYITGRFLSDTLVRIPVVVLFDIVCTSLVNVANQSFVGTNTTYLFCRLDDICMSEVGYVRKILHSKVCAIPTCTSLDL